MATWFSKSAIRRYKLKIMSPMISKLAAIFLIVLSMINIDIMMKSYSTSLQKKKDLRKFLSLELTNRNSYSNYYDWLDTVCTKLNSIKINPYFPLEIRLSYSTSNNLETSVSNSEDFNGMTSKDDIQLTSYFFPKGVDLYHSSYNSNLISVVLKNSKKTRIDKSGIALMKANKYLPILEKGHYMFL